MKLFKKIYLAAAAVILALSCISSALQTQAPAEYYAVRGQTLQTGLPFVKADVDQVDDAAAQKTGGSYQVKLKLFGVIPVSSAQVTVIDPVEVKVSGNAFGLKMLTNGVIVVDTSSILTVEGSKNPARQAGIQEGDILKTANGQLLTGNHTLGEIIRDSKGQPVSIEGERNGETIAFELEPVLCQVDNYYKGGIWVRDSTAGIGTMTFFLPETGLFGGLGHGVNDVDTGLLMPLSSGEIMNVTVAGCVKGVSGAAGELKGYFSSPSPVGKLLTNRESGVYGEYYPSSIPEACESFPVALKQEVKEGAAQILTTVDETGPQLFQVEITKVSLSDKQRTQNLVLRVTDENLIAITGGIVQGMSGSPILQNGRLVGAVTHVFLNNPQKGYGIFAENMLQEQEVLQTLSNGKV